MMVFGNLNNIYSSIQTKYLGKLKYFLRMEIAQSNSGVVISQRKYVLDILEKTSRHSYGSECQACTMTRGASMRSREISTTSGKTKLPHHHLTKHFFSCECS